MVPGFCQTANFAVLEPPWWNLLTYISFSPEKLKGFTWNKTLKYTLKTFCIWFPSPPLCLHSLYLVHGGLAPGVFISKLQV